MSKTYNEDNTITGIFQFRQNLLPISLDLKTTGMGLV